MDAKTVLGAFVSFALNMVGWIATGTTQSTPFLNPSFADPLKNFLSSLPLVGGFLTPIPSTLLLMAVSFLVVWLVVSAFFTMFAGYQGIFMAFLVGGIIVLFFTGAMSNLTANLPFLPK